jgi:co-chaperonin GroES (HSP10)
MIPLKVLGDRVLVKPDVLENAPEQHGGLYVAKTLAAAVTGEDVSTSLCRGTVVAVGNPQHPLKHEAEALARKMELWANVGHVEADDELDAARMLRDLVRRQPCCLVGDDVLFSHDAGQEITLDNDTYVLMKEDELLAVIEPEKEAVA